MIKKVKFNISNYTKCMCPVCPVQGKSRCIKDKKEGWKKTRINVGYMLAQYHKYPETYDLEPDELKDHKISKEVDVSGFGPAEAIEIYCSGGKSSCDDLDKSKLCLCPTCEVWKKNRLVATYFCLSQKDRLINLVKKVKNLI